MIDAAAKGPFNPMASMDTESQVLLKDAAPAPGPAPRRKAGALKLAAGASRRAAKVLFRDVERPSTRRRAEAAEALCSRRQSSYPPAQESGPPRGANRDRTGLVVVGLLGAVVVFGSNAAPSSRSSVLPAAWKTSLREM